MKITKIGKESFFRNTSKGQLALTGKQADMTTEIINKLPLPISFAGRMLLNPDHPKRKQSSHNPFVEFVKELTKGSANISLPVISQKTGQSDDVNDACIKIIRENLSPYGRRLKFDEDSLTLEELLMLHYNGQDIMPELKRLQTRIAELIQHKKENLNESINKNRIPFKPVTGEEILRPTSPRMKGGASYC